MTDMAVDEFSYVWTFFWGDETVTSCNAPFGKVGRITEGDNWYKKLLREYPTILKNMHAEDKALDYIEVAQGKEATWQRTT